MDLRAHLEKGLLELDLVVDRPSRESLVRLLDELQRWNRSRNLTAINEPTEAIEKHLVDSMTLLPLLDHDGRLLDIGSGAGFPALPLKIARPELEVVSVDAAAKKISFQKHVIRTLGLSGIIAWHGRAEQVPEQDFGAERFDFVVARAFSALDRFVELALPCLRPAGRIIAMKGPEGEKELRAAAGKLDSAGVQCLDLVELRLPFSGAARQLLILGRRTQDIELSGPDRHHIRGPS